MDTNSIIRDFLSNPVESSMNLLIAAARTTDFKVEDIAYLASGLAKSGTIIRKSQNLSFFDIPSTGGPSSLSTLLCPLILSIFNKKVLKLGVPGRPAGGIDVLSQLNGYKYSLSTDELERLIDQTNYIHFLANDTFAPLDIKLFNYRKKMNSIGVVNLVIASILSKKLAVGVTNLGLDIRVSVYGNFGVSSQDAIENAFKFNEVAQALNINSKCFITSVNSPQQPYIGRGESLLGLRKVFENKTDNLLRKHVNDCIKMSLAIIQEECIFNDSIFHSLCDKFKENIEIQGSNYDVFLELTDRIEYEHINEIIAPDTGFLNIDLEKMRDVICFFQNQMLENIFPDPCGIIIKSEHGFWVRKGDVLATYRCHKEFKNTFKENIEKAFIIERNIFDKQNIIII